ncbi:uncharacterized protein LOC116286340 [Actinia tenebrosa]|uniref:Uncharacterized protein LOC116286340 n=1 Tax=Actinia tenebrosa TaxID=6105 RepID=A0A6P8GWP4_ACTTE|nr:uncharacterized protein LOC116286340 [Actinia tenebrosa]
MTTFSGGRYDVLRDQSDNESPEEEEDLHEVPKSNEKKKKKKKKKKKQGDESGNGALKPDRTEAEKVVVSATQHLTKNNNKKKSANQGILSSEFNFTLPKGTNKKGKETHNDEEGEEEASTGILSSESTASLPKPIGEEGIETNDNKEGGEGATSTSIHSFESNASLPKPIDEEEMETNDNREGEGGATSTSIHSPESTKERQNRFQVMWLVNGVGLTALRKLFMDIHPTWSNNSADAKSLDKGRMILSEEHELVAFNNGDINKWDVSLITKVLLYSKKCKEVISKRLGFKRAICCIKRYKDKLVSHACDEKMSDADYQVHWPAISGHLETIGASKEEIDTILKENGKVYHDQLSSRHDYPNWDEWMKFRNNVRNFDHSQNNYILVTDAISPELTECYSVFRSVPWKMVLDFDPSSEEAGMYQDFTSKDGTSSLINMITPGEIRRLPFSSLSRHIDAKKTQWMFVNGRKSDGSDGGPQHFEDWEDVSLKEITKFFGCFSEPDKFDKNMPVICLVLPFKKESVPFIEVTLRRLVENFNEFNLQFVGIKQDQCGALSDRLLKKINLQATDLGPQLLRLAMEDLFHISSEQSYCMPTSQANVPAKLTQKEYLYLKEYLDVLYEGCEDPADLIDDDDDFVEERKKSFMSGNCISFVSLSYNHDAKREISNVIRTHIQRILDQGPSTHPSIVEISHSPGSGGSTIARRVMWDLHKSYPCVFAKLEDHKNDLEDDSTFLDHLADRIIFVQDKCYTTPVVLLDGKHTSIEALSSRLARNLNSKGRKAVLLRCNHTSGEGKSQSIPESSEVHARFCVNVKLEKSKADLKEFKDKYKDYIEDFKKIKSVSGLSRVFHFPLLAMLGEFRPKLQQIVYESFDEMEPLEKEIVLVVAFLQKYAARATPAPLLYAAFKNSFQQSSKQAITYEDISKIITEPLSNLMVPADPTKFLYQGRYKRLNYFQERYTLQHPDVAELVLKKAKMTLKQDTMAITRDFLGFPIYDDIRFIPLMKDLFVLNGSLRGGGFSSLFKELNAMNSKEAGELFCEAADKTKDVAVVTGAARFFANLQSPSFEKAKELTDKAFECRNAKDKRNKIYDVKGVVLSKEIRFLSNNEQINSLQELQGLAEKAISSFRKAKSNFPSFPNPLIGEVKTWLTCIDWITKTRFNGDSNKTLEFITSREAPSFFQTCINHSFNLLDTVDEIVQSANNLPDPDKTQREANRLRLGLIKTIRKSNEGRSAEETEVVEVCKALCSAEFPASSELELKRLQVQYLLSSVKQMESLSTEALQYLMELLTELVEVEKDAVFAKHLMKVCILIDGFSLDRGLEACEIWSRISNYDPFPYFYEMMICFLEILDGRTFEYRSKYHESLDNCKAKSQHNYKKMMSTHFLGKEGEGMSRLMTKAAFFSGETEYKSSISEVAETYWKTKSRKKLLECCGRIKSRTSSSGKDDHLIIELLQGNVELHVARKASIGAPDRDFVPGSKVYFVVSFNLLGPVANGITFKPSNERSDTEEK